MTAQDTSMLMSGLLQGQRGGLGALGGAGNASQVIGNMGENGASPFSSSLRDSLQQLLSASAPGAASSDLKALKASLAQLLNGQAANNGQGLPLLQGQDVAALDMETLLARLTPAQADSVAELLAGEEQGGAINLLPEQANALAEVMQQLKRALDSEHNPVNAGVELAWTPPVTAEQPEMTDKRAFGERVAALANAHSAHSPESGRSPLAQDQQQLLDSDTLLDSGQRLSPQQPANASPAMLERMMMNLSQERRTADNFNFSDNQLDSLTSLQAAQSQGRPATAVADARAPLQQSFIQTPLSDPQWQQDFSSRVVMLAKGGAAGQAQVAEIRLNPAQMGPVEVRVVMNDDQASITFSAQHSAVRDAIDASLPRLREMFNNSGMQLADASVSDQSLQDRQQRHDRQPQADGQHLASAGLPFDDEAERIVSQIDLAAVPGHAALDLYA